MLMMMMQSGVYFKDTVLFNSGLKNRGQAKSVHRQTEKEDMLLNVTFRAVNSGLLEHGFIV